MEPIAPPWRTWVLDPSALSDAWESLPGAERSALEEAAQRIERYHRAQRRASWSYTDELGNELGQRVTPLDRVGVYVPARPSGLSLDGVDDRAARCGRWREGHRRRHALCRRAQPAGAGRAAPGER